LPFFDLDIVLKHQLSLFLWDPNASIIHFKVELNRMLIMSMDSSKTSARLNSTSSSCIFPDSALLVSSIELRFPAQITLNCTNQC
jgi:hypothetical protein